MLLLGGREGLELASPMGEGDYWAKKTVCNLKAALYFARIQERLTLSTGRLKDRVHDTQDMDIILLMSLKQWQSNFDYAPKPKPTYDLSRWPDFSGLVHTKNQ